jgi:hypothetical protein
MNVSIVRIVILVMREAAGCGSRFAFWWVVREGGLTQQIINPPYMVNVLGPYFHHAW